MHGRLLHGFCSTPQSSTFRLLRPDDHGISTAEVVPIWEKGKLHEETMHLLSLCDRQTDSSEEGSRGTRMEEEKNIGVLDRTELHENKTMTQRRKTEHGKIQDDIEEKRVHGQQKREKEGRQAYYKR